MILQNNLTMGIKAPLIGIKIVKFVFLFFGFLFFLHIILVKVKRTGIDLCLDHVFSKKTENLDFEKSISSHH